MNMSGVSEWTAILDDLSSFLRWQQECGVRTEMFPPETARALLTMAPAGAGPGSSAQQPTRATPGQKPASRTLTQNPNSPAASSPAPQERIETLKAIAGRIAACERCELCRKRTQTVPGQGNALSPDILFIGEAPGVDEDAQGLAFVGAAGQLLTKMIIAMGYTREEVFIANICKCRPPGNRPPTVEEMQACLPFLHEQIAMIQPKVIVALGATAVRGLLESNVGISRLRGTWTTYANIPLMPTYHPSYLLRLPPAKRDAWEDLKKVLHRLGKTPPERQKPPQA